MTALIIGGFFRAKATGEIISNVLLLPVIIFLWINIVRQFTGVKKNKKLKVVDKNK